MMALLRSLEWLPSHQERHEGLERREEWRQSYDVRIGEEVVQEALHVLAGFGSAQVQ